ncbi:MAG: hypothetical protein JW795_03005, partial [Chitinivibrionales bacterium]|nr:hypothetical protein [Chitinivibrionales bacterium]
MDTKKIESMLKKAEQGITRYLKNALDEGKIDQQLYESATRNTYENLSKWLTDEYIDVFSPSLKKGIFDTIEREQWVSLVNAYRQSIRFGTGGIRGMMAFDRQSIVRLYKEGLDAPILKGPNTLNNIVLLVTSVGVAQFGKQNGLKKIVIGYDSRVRGADFAALVAQLFLAYDYTVYFFDAPCPYPEITFAIPDSLIKADMGILISASHNDYRYNGYKLSCGNGSQFDPQERDVMYKKFIAHAQTKDIKLVSFKDASADKLYFLGAEKSQPNFQYAGKERNLIDIHVRHRNHIKSFLLYDRVAESQKNEKTALNIGYCAFHGAGTVAVPRLLKETGYKNIYEITSHELNVCNGLFPSFRSIEGMEQQPDPGDFRAARIAVDAFKEDHPGKFDTIDVLLGTDP